LIFSPIALQDEIGAFYKIADQTLLRIVLEALSGVWEALLDRRVDLLIGAASEGPAGGGYTLEPIGEVPFIFAVAVADSARRLPTRTVGLSFGQDKLTVPDMHAKYQFQVAGLGFGFLPQAYARNAIAKGLLVENRWRNDARRKSFILPGAPANTAKRSNGGSSASGTRRRPRISRVSCV
jgi:DNA-binding transcriptional LysR family regulator